MTRPPRPRAFADALAFRAWFEARPPGYRRSCSFWAMSAKLEPTRERRFAALVEASRRGESIPPLRALERARAKTKRAARRG